MLIKPDGEDRFLTAMEKREEGFNLKCGSICSLMFREGAATTEIFKIIIFVAYWRKDIKNSLESKKRGCLK